MQPFIAPVDHESRHSTSIPIEENTENTPLLTRDQVVESIVNNRTPSTVMVVVLLLVVLLIGVSISIYLLIEQQNSLPPIEVTLLVSKAHWDSNNNNSSLSQSNKLPKPNHVIVVATNSNTCYSTEDCLHLLSVMRKEVFKETGINILPYNYLVSSNGEAFEELAWESSLIPGCLNCVFVVGLIGNFTQVPPTSAQVNKAVELFEESVRQGYLNSNYTIISKKVNSSNYLHQTLRKLPNFDIDLSE